jgi:uncharacterized protein (UPF0276 family)
MSDERNPLHETRVGVGFGLRWDFLDELMRRLEAGTLDAVPFFEVSPENYMRRGGYIPESLEFVADHVPLITHGLMMSLGGTDPFDEDYFANLRAFTRRFDTPWHSDHMCFSGVDGRIFHDLLPMPQTREAGRHVAKRVREARDRLELPMAIENISYYLRLGRPDLEETEVLSLILDEADCGLLLDVNNVYVNGKNHGFDPKTWIERMDLDRVMQIHVAGHEFREGDGLIIDTHGSPVVDPVYELLEWTIARTGPVAVILERDNDVPDLDEMLREWRLVTEAYERGLATHRRTSRPPRSRRPAERPYDVRRLVEAQRALDFTVRTSDDEALRDAMAQGFPTLELDDADAASLREADLRHVRVYRRLVRGNLIEAIRNQIPRTAARLGDDAYEGYVRRFAEEELPRSQILRDVPYEFTAWAAPRWLADDHPPHLADLARYELLEFDVYTAERLGSDLRAEELLADAPVAFDTSVRVGAFDHAVHALVDDVDDRTLPEAQPSHLLAYRDADGAFRQLDLTPLASRILGRLLLGDEFAPAVASACTDRGVAVDQSVIEGTSEVLADLADRGVVLGALHRPRTRDPSPFFRWLMGSAFVAR